MSERATREETVDVVWSGNWVAERLGVALEGDGELRELLGLALRRNPKRAHLLVSNVLGKHVPQRPSVVHGAGFELGERVRALLGAEGARRAVVLGYAETATGLGHAVADGLRDAPYLHSTRRPVAGVEQAGGFEESHSHATSHLLLPEDRDLLASGGTGADASVLVLVGDEFSTGNTVLNTIRALHALHPRERYVIVALVDMRSAGDRDRLTVFAAEIGARVDLVTRSTGTVALPDGVLERGQALVAAQEAEQAKQAEQAGRAAHAGRAEGSAGAVEDAASAPVTRVDLDWPAGVPDGGRHGFTPAHRAALEAALPAMADRIAAELGDAAGPAPRRVLVLGFEELMYAPLRLGTALEAALGADAEVRYSTTTRSPVLAVGDPGYAIRTRLVFPAHDDPADGPGDRYAYNVAGAGFDAVVAVADSTADTPELHAPDGLLARLAEHTGHVLLAVLPSYVPATAAPTGVPGTPHPPPNGRSPPCCPSPSEAPTSPVTRPRTSAGSSRTSRTPSWKRPPRSARRRSRAAARTTRSRCPWSTSRAPSTRPCSPPPWRPPPRASPARSAPSPRRSSPNAGPAPCSSRSPAPEPRSAC